MDAAPIPAFRRVTFVLLVLITSTTYATAQGGAENRAVSTPDISSSNRSAENADSLVNTSEPPRERLELTLDDCLQLALLHNLGIRIERLNYERTHRGIALARAAFDPIFATSFTMAKFRSPTVDFLSGLNPTTDVAVNPFTNQDFQLGLSGLLPIGTQYSVTAQDNIGDNPESGFFALNPRHTSTARLSVTQPLLRGFGTDNNLADLHLANNNALSSRLGFGRLQE